MGNRRPVISVIMPVYNCEMYIKEAIDSILYQSFSDFEFIIINDGSTDGSFKILQKYSCDDPRIKLISRENWGLIKSLNQALEFARGDFIARMDADDISYLDRFEKQVKILNETNGDICGGHCVFINKNGKLVKTIIFPVEEDSFVVHHSLSVPFAHGSVMFRKSFIEKYNIKYGTKTKYAEDYALWLECYFNGAIFCNVDDFIYKYRSYNTSFSKVNSREYRRDSKSLITMFLKHDKEKHKNSILRMLKKYDELSEREKELLILSAYLYSRYHKALLFIKVLYISPPKIMLISISKILINKLY